MTLTTGTCVAAAGIPGFILGVVLTVIILIVVPKVLRPLRFAANGGCLRPREEGAKEKADASSNMKSGSRKSSHYMEIDEKKTRTFAHKKHLHQAKVSENEGHGYEDCVMGAGTHKYSDIEVEGSNTNGTVNKTPGTNSYEPFSPGKQNTAQENSNHEYFILEPGSDKRLPVKLLENNSDTLPCDQGHVYFKLEPGTNKVSPVFDNLTVKDTKGSTGRPLDRESGHIYFVLEPMTESAESETLAYAVNDVATSPHFILEKLNRAS